MYLQYFFAFGKLLISDLYMLQNNAEFILILTDVVNSYDYTLNINTNFVAGQSYLLQQYFHDRSRNWKIPLG